MKLITLESFKRLFTFQLSVLMRRRVLFRSSPKTKWVCNKLWSSQEQYAGSRLMKVKFEGVGQHFLSFDIACLDFGH